MKYDMVVSDYDWTLGVSPDVIDEGTLEAIRKYKEKGGKFVVVSGRSYCSLRGICEKRKLDGLVGCFQGSMVVDIKNNKTLYKEGIDYNLASEAVNELLKEGFPVVAWSGDTLFYREPSFYTQNYMGVENVIKIADLSKTILERRCPVPKICCVCDNDRVEYLVEKYSKLFEGKLAVNSGAKQLVELINPKFHKGYAVRYIAKQYNIPLNKVMTIGDSLNDYELVKGPWYGVAVGDGAEQLKKVAKEVVVPFSENPVKYILEKYCL